MLEKPLVRRLALGWQGRSVSRGGNGVIEATDYGLWVMSYDLRLRRS